MTTATGLDVVTATILRAKLEAVVDDMGTALTNTAHSSRISTSRAFACAVLDATGEVVALDNPLHLASVGETAAVCIEYYRFATAAADVLISNDPYGGGTSVHYFTLIAPLGYGDDIVAYVAVQAHMIDIGGVVMGNYHPTATELWAEGARFTPLKLVVDGNNRRDAFDTIVLNSRDPEGFRGDLDAMLATVAIGRQRLLALVNEYGLTAVHLGMSDSVDYAERRLRAELARLPEGRFHGEATLDHDGQGVEDLVIRADLERRGDTVLVDLTRSDDQSLGFVNSPTMNTRGFALLPFLSVLDATVPCNAGLLRATEILTRKGSLVDPAFPAPTGWCREHVGYEIAEAVGQALASALPDQAGLGYANRSLVFTVTKDVRVGGVEEQLGVTDYTTVAQTGSPARSDGDGWGQAGPASAGLLHSVEEFEGELDATVLGLEYATDSGGAGRWRGGLGTETLVSFPAHSLERLYACVAGARHPDPGYAGGLPGAASGITLSGPGNERAITTLVEDLPLGEGAELRIRAGGGGGFGDPARRLPEDVLRDVLDGYVSMAAARSSYLVAVDPETLAVDETATASLRAEGAR